MTGADVRDFARRWLGRENRTVGFLVADLEASFVERRVAVPPLRTPPAKRMRPDPVPPNALEPLRPLSIATARRVLRNGVVVRAARSREGAGDPHVRIAFTESADSAAIAALLARDTVSQRLGARVSWQGQGARRARDSAAARVYRALPRDSNPRRAGWPITVAVAGLGEPGRLLDAAAGIFGRLPAREPRAVSVTASGDAREERVPVPGGRQVDVHAGLPGVPRDHPDRRALELLNYIVGVPSYGGRLGWALTKTGLTYSSAAATTFGERAGQIVFSTRCDSRNTDATIQAIREVVEGIGANGVEPWELDEAKAFVLGRTLLYGAREDSDTRALAAALIESEQARLDLLDLPALSRTYLSISLADINRVAKRYYRPELLKVVAAGALPSEPEQIFPPGTFRALFEP